jgi:hypothetical protein
MTVAMGKLFDAGLTGSEVQLVIRTLRLRVFDLVQERDNHLRFAAELPAEPRRLKFYQDCADDAAHEIDRLSALLSRLA